MCSVSFTVPAECAPRRSGLLFLGLFLLLARVALSRPAMCHSSLREPRAVSWLACCMGSDSSRGEVRLSDLEIKNARAAQVAPLTAQVAPSRPAICRVSLHGPVPSLSLSWLTRCMGNDSSRGEVRFSELGMENSRALRPVTAQVAPSRPAVRRASLHGPVPFLSLSWLTFAWVLFFARRGSISRFRHGKRSSSPPRDRGGRALSAGNGRLS